MTKNILTNQLHFGYEQPASYMNHAGVGTLVVTTIKNDNTECFYNEPFKLATIYSYKGAFYASDFGWDILSDVMDIKTLLNSLEKAFIAFCEYKGIDDMDKMQADNWPEGIHHWGMFFQITIENEFMGFYKHFIKTTGVDNHD